MYPIQYIADTNILWKIINNSVLLSGYSNPMKFRGDPWNSREQFPRNSINLFKGIPRKMDFYGNRWRHFHGIPWKCMERFPWNFMECFHRIPWKLCPNPSSNSMEMHGQISLEFHRNQCLNPPWNFFPYVKIFIDDTKLKYQFNFCISLIDGNFDANENLSW